MVFLDFVKVQPHLQHAGSESKYQIDFNYVKDIPGFQMLQECFVWLRYSWNADSNSTCRNRTTDGWLCAGLWQKLPHALRFVCWTPYILQKVYTIVINCVFGPVWTCLNICLLNQAYIQPSASTLACFAVVRRCFILFLHMEIHGAPEFCEPKQQALNWHDGVGGLAEGQQGRSQKHISKMFVFHV